MNNTDKYLKIFLYVSLLAIGIVIGIAIRHFYDLPLEETFNIVDLATLVATAFLAVYIPKVLDRKLQIQRDKKDLIESRIVELQELYRNINLVIQGEEPMTPKDFLVVKNYLDVSNHKLDTIITLLTYSNMHTSFTHEIQRIRELAEEHKNLLWYDEMEEGTITYEDDIQEKEELLYNRIDEATSLLIFRISEAQ
ncbi:MAG: hypothetical protein LUG96_03985 [Tannerellaceae bacterium]|nr:hypothetical protein [Tannerellaceae bacterium]